MSVPTRDDLERASDFLADWFVSSPRSLAQVGAALAEMLAEVRRAGAEAANRRARRAA